MLLGGGMLLRRLLEGRGGVDWLGTLGVLVEDWMGCIFLLSFMVSSAGIGMLLCFSSW